MLKWNVLENEEQLSKLNHQSNNETQVIFKHSTRCSISSMAKNRLEKNAQPPGVVFHFLDLIKHRNLSNAIATNFKVHHQSPQVLVIKNGECVYNESHTGIDFEEIILKAKAA